MNRKATKNKHLKNSLIPENRTQCFRLSMTNARANHRPGGQNNSFNAYLSYEFVF